MRFVRYHVYTLHNNNKLYIMCNARLSIGIPRLGLRGADADDFHRSPRDRSLLVCSTGVGNNNIPLIYLGKNTYKYKTTFYLPPLGHSNTSKQPYIILYDGIGYLRTRGVQCDVRIMKLFPIHTRFRLRVTHVCRGVSD